jgi:hypothetical protein
MGKDGVEEKLNNLGWKDEYIFDKFEDFAKFIYAVKDAGFLVPSHTFKRIERELCNNLDLDI